MWPWILFGPARVRSSSALLLRNPGWTAGRLGGAGRGRLPTVAEWLGTVRGSDGHLYPWGNGWQHDAVQCPGPWGTWGHSEHPEWAVDPSGNWCRCGPFPHQIQSADVLELLHPMLLQRNG